MRVAENKGITLFPIIRNNQPKLSSLSAKGQPDGLFFFVSKGFLHAGVGTL